MSDQLEPPVVTQISYWNTTRESGPELAASVAQAQRQEAWVLALFEASPWRDWTPWEVMEAAEAQGCQWPITSLRRAMNTLTERRLLAKTDRQREGRYGKRNYVWTLTE